MFTNVFRIGGLHQVSWFQLFAEGEVPSPSSTRKESSRKDSAAIQVMRAHLWLQESGNLSSWALSDDKVKLWLFLPGRHDSLNPLVHVAVTGLKVVESGLWRAPGECNEIASALDQALRNRIERGFRSLSYVRFGDVFVKCWRHSANDLNLRKSLASCELNFSASNEAIFVHVLVRRKRVQQLLISDMQAALAQQRSNLGFCDKSLAVIVAPNGLSGCLSGCCPDDLVIQLYRSKLQAFDASSLPFNVVGSTSASDTSLQPCFPEVLLKQRTRSTQSAKPSVPGVLESKLPEKAINGVDSGHVFVFPLDAVLVPMLPVVPSHSFIRRCWLQEWACTTWLEAGMEEEVPSLNGKSGLNDGECREKSTIIGFDGNGSDPSHSSGAVTSSNSSRGSSSSSSQGSSGTSSSGDAAGGGLREVEADADSLGSKAAGALTSNHSDMRAPATLLQGLDLHSVDLKSSQVTYSQGTKRGRTKPMLGVASFDPPSKALKRSNGIGNDILGLTNGPSNAKMEAGFLGEASGFGVGMSSSMGAGTPMVGGSLVGNPWDQCDNDGGFGMGLGMDIQSDADILAEFGDFGDFFEDDGLGFGEPPDTAESQALMFSLPDYGEVTQSPGTAPLDASDPMVLPILDFTLLEKNHSGDLQSDMKRNAFTEVSQDPIGAHPSHSQPTPALDLRLKSEALLCFAPGFEPVEMAGVPGVSLANLRDPYVPVARKSVAEFPHKELYSYSAMPLSYPKLDISDVGKYEQRSNESPNEARGKEELTADYIIFSGSHGSRQVNLNDKVFSTGDLGPERAAGMALGSNKQSVSASVGGNGSQIPGSSLAAESPSTLKHREGTKLTNRSPVAVLATDLECALLQVMLCRSQGSSSVSGHSCRSGVASPENEAVRGTPLPLKDSESDITQVQFDTLAQSVSCLAKSQQERRKIVPERIAGHEEDIHDGPNRVVQVGVWRPVGVPNARELLQTLSRNNENAVRLDTCSPVDPCMGDLTGVSERQSLWQEILEAVPLLAQQASIAVDVSLDGRYGDGPFGWLAAREIKRQQCNRRADCSQAGGWGMLATASCLDQSVMEILNPLSAEISAATAASLLHSDVRVAMSNAFGKSAADGPLALVDWCKRRVQASDCVLSGESTNTNSSLNSTITVVGESTTPSQSGGGQKGTDVEDIRRGSSSSRAIDSSSVLDQTDPLQRRGLSDDLSLSQTDALGYQEPTIRVLSTPCFLVGYQDDWLKTSSRALHLWEKAALEPYALSKQVNYHVVCLASEPLVTAAVDFFQQLSSVYEACRLGSHTPSGTVAGKSGLTGSSSKQNLSGFALVDVPGLSYSSAREKHFNACNYSLAKDFADNMAVNWNMADFRKALVKVCKALPISSRFSASQQDPEQGHCTVVYIVCPVADPAGILQTMIDACASLGSAIVGADSERHGAFTTGEDGLPLNILGYSIPRFALQLITAETIFKTSGSQTSSIDVFKEVALGVYNKVRRIPRRVQKSDSLQNAGVCVARGPAGNTDTSSFQTTLSLPGLWEDCNTQRRSGNATIGTLNFSSKHSIWEGGWKPSMQTDLGTSADATHETMRYLYEPAYILAEAGAPNSGVGFRSWGFDSTRDDTTGSTHGSTGVAGSGSEVGSSAATEKLDGDASPNAQHAADLHCCYTWSGDWNWLVSVWTDARGELLDTQLLPLTGGGTKRESSLQVLFDQILQQGLQLLNLSVESGSCKTRGLNITRLGGFYARECQEWHRVIMSAGAEEVRKWRVQIRHPDYTSAGSVGGTESSSDMGLITDRGLGLAGSGPTSPCPSSSSCGGRGKTSQYSNSGADLSSGITRRQNQATNQLAPTESSMGAFKWVHSISLVSLRADQSLQIVSTIDGAPLGNSSSAPSWPGGSTSSGVEGTGVNTVKTLASTGVSYLVIPSHVYRPLAPSLELLVESPCCEQSTLAQCLHNSGPACPVTTGFAVSGGTSTTSDFAQRGMKEDWPSTMSVGLMAYYAASSRLGSPVQDVLGSSKVFKSTVFESTEQALEAHGVLQVAALELHALSWLNVGLTYLRRRSPLPFHCEVAQRFQRLLDFLDAECGHGPIVE